jgi:hypothetical protein
MSDIGFKKLLYKYAGMLTSKLFRLSAGGLPFTLKATRTGWHSANI